LQNLFQQFTTQYDDVRNATDSKRLMKHRVRHGTDRWTDRQTTAVNDYVPPCGDGGIKSCDIISNNNITLTILTIMTLTVTPGLAFLYVRCRD